jgi:predicted N-acetyltransferase YhbS
MDRDAQASVSVRSLREQELAAADSIFRRSFGTFLGLENPLAFGGDSDFLVSRWRADPGRVFAAEHDGELVGTNVASHWGSLGFFGPLTVKPEQWGRGVGQALVNAAMEQFAAWGNSHLGLFTFSDSPKHLHLYEKFGFSARFLTAVMSKAVAPQADLNGEWSPYGGLTNGGRETALQDCRAVADAVFAGLDPTREIEAVQTLQLGDTGLLLDGDQIGGFAVCHCGPGSEATKGECYVKFGAVRPGAGADLRFTRLLSACEAFAGSRGLERLIAGVNLACDAAYRQMRVSGFRTDFVGVAMQKPNEPGCLRSDSFLIADWR